MRLPALLLLLLAPAAVLASPAADATSRLLVLHREGAHNAETRLADALRLYTRDLGCEVVLATGVAEPSGHWPALPSRGAAEFVLWLDDAGASVAVQAVRLAPLEQRRLEVKDASDRFTSLAMKVRALVARPPVASIPKAVPAPLSEAAPAAPPSEVALEIAAAPAVDEVVSPPSDTVIAPLTPEELPTRVAVVRAAESTTDPTPSGPAAPTWIVDVRYDLGTTLAPSHLLVSGTLRVTRSLFGPLALALDASILSGTLLRASPGDTRLSDKPIGLSALWQRSWGGLELSAGPRLRLHLLKVDESPGQRRDHDMRPGLGLGVTGTLSRPVWDGFALQLTAAAESLVRRPDLGVEGIPAPTLVRGSLMLALGVAWFWR